MVKTEEASRCKRCHGIGLISVPYSDSNTYCPNCGGEGTVNADSPNLDWPDLFTPKIIPKDAGILIPWNGKGRPVIVTIGKNNTMDCWEVTLNVGAFDTEDEAEAYSHLLAQHFRKLEPHTSLKDVQATVVGEGNV